MNLNFFNRSSLTTELYITKSELDRILEHSKNPELMSAGHETVAWDKDLVMNVIKAKLDKEKEKMNIEKANSELNKYLDWQKSTEPWKLKGEAIWEKIRKKDLVKDINENPNLSNLNLSNINEFLHSNKDLVLSNVKSPTIPLTENKPLGSTGDITLNELNNKGIVMVDNPLLQLINEHININYLGATVTSMIMYRAVMKMFMKAAYPKIPLTGLPYGTSPNLSSRCTRSWEIAAFMLLAAPGITCALMGINHFTGEGSKIIINIGENTGLEESSSGISKSSFFLFLNKLPSWLKVILKYIVYSLIITFITSIIGYKSNILSEIALHFSMYLVIILKIFAILNFFVLCIYIVRLYIITMFANNKDYINLEDYEDYPKFIKNELIVWKDIATKLTQIELEKFYKHCYFLIILYLSVVLLCLTAVVLISNSIY